MISGVLKGLWSNLTSVLLGVIALLAGLLTFSGWQSKNRKYERDIYKRQAKKRQEVLDRDNELEVEHDSDLKRLKDEDAAIDSLAKPNDEWLH